MNKHEIQRLRKVLEETIISYNICSVLLKIQYECFNVSHTYVFVIPPHLSDSDELQLFTSGLT